MDKRNWNELCLPWSLHTGLCQHEGCALLCPCGEPYSSQIDRWWMDACGTGLMQTGIDHGTVGGHPIAPLVPGEDAGGLAWPCGEPFADRMGSGQMGGSLTPFRKTESGTRSDCERKAARIPFDDDSGQIPSDSPNDVDWLLRYDYWHPGWLRPNRLNLSLSAIDEAWRNAEFDWGQHADHF